MPAKTLCHTDLNLSYTYTENLMYILFMILLADDQISGSASSVLLEHTHAWKSGPFFLFPDLNVYKVGNCVSESETTTPTRKFLNV